VGRRPITILANDRAFAILIPPGDEETERDRLCAECPGLPEPPHPD
jgi:hypothetical protein